MWQTFKRIILSITSKLKSDHTYRTFFRFDFKVVPRRKGSRKNHRLNNQSVGVNVSVCVCF